MIRLTENDWRIFRRLQRKHNVSTEFLRYNIENIEKFIWYETWPRIVIKRYAIRKNNRVFIIYYRLRRVLFDQCNRKLFKRMRQNIKQWSKRMVTYLKDHKGINEYVEELVFENNIHSALDTEQEIAKSLKSSDDVSKQLKEQLELLKSGRRPPPLISSSKPKDAELDKEHQIRSDADEEINTTKNLENQKFNNVGNVGENLKDHLNSGNAKKDLSIALNITPSDNASNRNEAHREWQINLESTPEKQLTTQENLQPIKLLATDEKTEKSHTEDDNGFSSLQQTDKVKTGFNFLDMLMSKVTGSSTNNNDPSNIINKPGEKSNDNSLSRMTSSTSLKENINQEHSMDSTDGFLGFDDCERIPGMLMTPIVPHSTRNNKNSVFVSESLNEYMRVNDLETNYSIDEDKSITRSKIYARDMEGLMTPKTMPPHFDMPAVPENLLKFRTVAERKQYLQKFSKNYRLAIINNEASIYRELQRRMRTQKVKSASQQLAQSPNSSMSFTRNGWKAASFINTEFNKYYYQILEIDNGLYKVRLRGARGNNDEFRKTPYISRIINPPNECPYHCVDERIWPDLKPIKTIASKTKKLNNEPFPSVFKPCPLSHKTFQKPLDDDTAALLLAGGSMAVVRMPTVELEVFPECGRPLHEIAKRYLQYILPHHDISREWAEFSVSTLQQPKSLKEAEQAAAKSFSSKENRKSYTFVIPYLNDRNHILVRRVVDRSEKLDHSFQNSLEEKELVPKNDFSFRQILDENDKELIICADVVSDMINTVAISCSENSFIKNDPDVTSIDDEEINTDFMHNKLDANGLDRPLSSSPNTTATPEIAKKQKKQNSLLLELKRLNATIIDAANKTDNDSKPCSKAYCQMGCVCSSLAEDLPMREHCGKSKCMLECTCKSSNQSRIMRLETDGRTITTEDAFMLRRKATARLARMEKEFTSTVVLTENETLLINETNNDKKRRCTKAPKRYEDFTDTEDEQRKNSPKKSALTSIDNCKNLAVEIKELREPVYVKDSVLEQLKHCTVNLVPLQDMDNVVPWCMIHNLYKCFCKGRAVEGKPVVIEKEDVNTTIEHASSEQSLELECTVISKPKYTFDKVEKRKKSITSDEDDDEEKFYEEESDYEKEQNEDNSDWSQKKKHKKKIQNEIISERRFIEEIKRNHNSNQSKSDDEPQKLVKNVYSTKSLVENLIEKNKPKPSLHEVRKRFFQPRDDCCRRQIPIPRRMFLYCNRKRRLNNLKFIKDNENENTRLLLNEHVMRSVYYHKIDSKSLQKNVQNKEESNKAVSENKVEKNSAETEKKSVTEHPCDTANSRKNSLPVNEIVDLLDDDEEQVTENKQEKQCDYKLKVLNEKDESSQRNTSRPIFPTSVENCLSEKEITDSNNQKLVCSNDKVITVKEFATLSALNTDQSVKKQILNPQEELSEASSESVNAEMKLPKIASCFSLNANANSQKATPKTSLTVEQQNLDFTSATSVNSAAFSQSQSHQAKPLTNPSTVSAANPKIDGSTSAINMENENVKDVYNSVIRTMNSLVSKKMQDIDCALQRESHIIPAPNADILCIMKWTNFLDAFCEGFAYVWQVKIKDVTLFAVTICNMMPLIAGAMGIVNITALKPDKMPLIGKMLLQRFRNKETEKLAVVMQGKQSHWVVKGFLRAEPLLACNKPTPDSHPSLTKKINVLCSLLVKQRQKDQRKKEKPMGQWTSPQMAMATQTALSATQHTETPKVAQIMPIRRITTAQQPADLNPPPTVPYQQFPNSPQIQSSPSGPQQLQQTISQVNIPNINPQNCTDTITNPIKVNIIEGGKSNTKSNYRKRKIDTSSSNNLLKADTYSKMSSNIEFRSVSQNDINEIFLPELKKLDHKWLVLDLHNDFSHIFVPDFRDLVSLDRIQKVINFARQKNKIVKLQFFQNAPFDAFVTPKSGRKIYFGPLTMEMKAPTLILLQSVDGQMMLRELYQLQHNIVKKPEEKTKAFWLIHVKGQTHFEMEINVNNEMLPEQKMTPALPLTPTTCLNNDKILNNSNDSSLKNNKNLEEINDDEDCMIIDDSTQNVNSNTQDRYNFTIKTSLSDTTVSITPQANSLPGPLPIQTLQTFKANNMETLMSPTATQSLLKVPNTNTIITPVNPTNSGTPVILNAPTISVTTVPLPLLALHPNTVITGIKPVPVSNVGASVLNLPTNALVTGITTAPPDAPYSSTIFITPSSSYTTTSALGATITTSTASINNVTTISTTADSPLLANDKSESNATQTNKSHKPSEVGAIKRRRISLFCSNKYDKVSENLAVDAVIKNILHDNGKYVQINPNVGENSTATKPVSAVVATVGSTKISKLSETESKNSNTNLESDKLNKAAKKPIVFDVNFMDDGDEPTASIVIKPNTSTSSSTNQTNSTTFSATQTNAVQLTSSTNTIISNVIPKSTVNTVTTTAPALAPDAYKTIKLPAVIGANANNPVKGKLIKALLSAKQQPIIAPKLSPSQPINSKLPTGLATSTTISSPIGNSIKAPFLIKRTSVPIKVQKVSGTSSSATTVQYAKPLIISSTTAVNNTAATKHASLATLTVQEVQAMLKKPGLNVTSTTSSAISATSVTPSTVQLRISPSIKATIASSIVPTNFTPAENISSKSYTTIAPSTPIGTSTVNTVSNSTLTISKVQSFGSPTQKNQNSNSEKKVQSSASPQGQTVSNEISKEHLPNPPSHIQYGYIVSASYGNQKFVAKRIAEEFYVKVPTVGILKLQGLGAVKTYLNKYISKTLKETAPSQADWKFVAASKAVQMQNHQKSLLVRKTKNTIGSLGLNKTSKTAPNTADSSLNEPILIDD